MDFGVFSPEDARMDGAVVDGNISFPKETFPVELLYFYTVGGGAE